MPTDKNIHDFVNAIWSPNISIKMSKKKVNTDKERHQFLISQLCKQSKFCSAKGFFTPYIQIKDEQEKFLFNDRLHISVADNYTPPSSSFHYSLDSVYDGNDKNTVYCIVTSNFDDYKK